MNSLDRWFQTPSRHKRQSADSPILAILLAIAMVAGPLTSIAPLATGSSPTVGSAVDDRIDWVDAWLEDHDEDGNLVDDRAEAIAADLIDEARSHEPVSLLVTYDHWPDQRDLDRLVAEKGATDDVYAFDFLPTVQAKVPASQVSELGDLPGVVAVEHDEPLEPLLDVSSPASQARSTPSGTGPYQGQTAQALGYGGSNSVVAVLDTGVQDQHSAFSDTRWVAGADVSTPAPADCVNPADDSGHGTHVASTVLGETSRADGSPLVGTAPEAGLVDVRIAVGGASLSGAMRGFEFVERYNEAIRNGDPLCPTATTDDRIDVATLSFGSLSPAQGDAGSIGQLIETLTGNGVAVTIAAGNCGPQGDSRCTSTGDERTVTRPANAEAGIAVANSDDRETIDRGDDAVSSSSSRGPVQPGASGFEDLEDRYRKPEIAAPGSSITAAGPSPGTISTLSGTSMAAPHVAGVAATLIQAGRDVATQTGGENLMLPTGSGYAADNEHASGENPIRDAIIHAAEYHTSGVSSTMLDKWEGPGADVLTWNNGYGYGHVDAFGALCWAWDNVLVPGGATPTSTVETACGLSTDFDVDAGGPYTAIPGETVELEATATGGTSPYTFAWDLDDDGAFDDATGPTASISFQATGTFPVAVHVTDAEERTRSDATSIFVSEDGTTGGLIEIVDPEEGQTVGEQVTVEGIVDSANNSAPSATFTSQTDGLTVVLDATDSSDPDGDELAFEWTLGDDSPLASGATVEHTYTQPGSYDVCLTVSDGSLTDDLCQQITVEEAGPVAIVTDPDGDATQPTTGNIPEMDITLLEAVENPDGSFTMLLTVNEMQQPTVPVEAGAQGAIWRVSWDFPGTDGHFVQFNTDLVDPEDPGSVRTSCSYGTWNGNLASSEGDAPCDVAFGAPATISVTFEANVMEDKGYSGDELLTNVRSTTNIYRGTPRANGVPSGGATSTVDTTNSGTFELQQSNSRLPLVGPSFQQGPRDAPEEPPADPHIVDEGGDVAGDTVPTSQQDIEAGWFDADAEHLYVGLKVADIPADATSTAFMSYRVAFTPDYEVDDPTWGGVVHADEGDSFTGLRVLSVFSPIAFDGLTGPSTETSPSFELQVLFDDATTGSSFSTLATLEDGRVDPDTDIIWWPVPRSDLQTPPPGAFLSSTTATTAPAVGGLVTFGGVTADNAGPGRDFQFPSGPEDEPPQVNLAADPTSGTVPLDVTFTGSTDAEEVASWTITYGDGASESGAGSPPTSFSHVYESAGDYTATLEVTDADTGLTGQGQASLSASAPAGRTVRVQAGSLDPVTATCEEDCASWQAPLDLSSLAEGPVTITAELLEDGEQTDTDQIDIVLSLDEGLVVDAPVDNQRLPPGDVRVQGQLDTADGIPQASLDADPTQGTAPLNVTFQIDASDDDGITSWRLRTDDGAVIDGSNHPVQRTHTYEDPGNYTPTLTVTDTSGQQDSAAIDVRVKEENTAPSEPNSPSPSDGAGDIALPPTLSWSASDPDGDDLTYDVFLDTSNPPATQIKADHPSSSLIVSELEADTTYHWQIVANDGLNETEGPVWSFTTSGEDSLADTAQTVVAYIDTGLNPYNQQFRRSDVTTHPSTYITGYPSNAAANNLCFFDETTGTVDQADCPSSVDQAANADLANGGWGNAFGVTPTSQTGPGQGDLAYVPGTNVIGQISFSHDGDSQFPTFDSASKGAGQGHGTMVAGSIAGAMTGSCPDCKIVVVEGDDVAAIEAGYRWAANQPWIDIVTSSTTIGILGAGGDPAGVLSNLDESSRTMVENGKIVFEASGNGAGNLGLLQTSTYAWHNSNPWTNPVGCAAPETGQPCAYHDSPNPITASGVDRNTAAADTFTGTTNTAGTSFASPSAAGVAGQTLLAVRAAMGDTTEGPDPTTKSLLHPEDGANLPADTAIANGELTKLELEEALYKTARRATVPQVPDQLLVGIDEVPNNPTNIYKETYGDVYRGDWGISHPTALDTWSSAGDAAAVLLGDVQMPNRFLEEFYWEQVITPTQEAIYGQHPAEPDDDGWPTDDEASLDGLDGHPASTSSTSASPDALTLAQAGGPPGQQPSVDNDRLFLHHAVSEDPNDPVNSQVDYWMNTVQDPGGGCSGNGCPDASGYGATGVSTSGTSSTYTMKNPALSGNLLLEEGAEIVVHVDATGFSQAQATPTELDVAVRADGSAIAAGTAQRQLDAAGESVYEARLMPNTQVVSGDLDLQISWDGPTYSMHVESQGASWLELPVAGELPELSFQEVPHYLDDFAASFSANGDTVRLTQDASKLQGDGDKTTFFPVPQEGGVVINLLSEHELATSKSLLGATGSADVWICTAPVLDVGAAQVTVKVSLSAGGTPIGGGSKTFTMAGIHDKFATPTTVPLTIHPALIDEQSEIEGQIVVTGPGDVLTPNVGFCGGSADKPWRIDLSVAELGAQTPIANITSNLTGELSDTVTVEGTYEAPSEPGVDEATWYATNMDEWGSASPEFQDPPLKLDTTRPGAGSGGPIFLPQPDGYTLAFTSEQPVVDDIQTLASDGVGRAQFWVSALGAATDVRVDMTVLLQDPVGNQRIVAEGSVQKHVSAPLGTISTVPTERFTIDFAPQVTDPQPEEVLVYRVHVTNVGDTATTSQVTCICGGQDRPIFVTLPADADTPATDEKVNLSVDSIVQASAPVTDGGWSHALDTTQLEDGEHELTAVPEATYGDDTRQGAPLTQTLTIQNGEQNSAPDPSLSLNQTSAIAPATIEATLNASDDDTSKDQLDYSLAWGDGSANETGTGLPATLAHTYPDPGTFQVVLTVTDQAGLSAKDSLTVHIAPPPAVDKILVTLNDTAPIEAIDDSDDGSLSNWHVDLADLGQGLHEITVEHVRDRGEQREVLQTESLLLRVAESGVPEVAIDAPGEGQRVHADTPIEGRVMRYTGEEAPGTTPTPMSSSSMMVPIAPAFAHTVDTVRPAPEMPQAVHVSDLQAALEHLLEANGEGPSAVASELAEAEVPEQAKPALASIAEATAQATALQREAVGQHTPEQLAWMREDPVRMASLDIDEQLLLRASMLVQATVDAHLSTLQAVEPVEQAGDPDIDLGIAAIDLGGDTEYPAGTTYALKIDLAGEDIHRDTAGGGVGVISVSIDVAGADTYEAGLDTDPSVDSGGVDAIAVQGAGDTGGIGILVDAAGEDTYEATGDLAGADVAAFVDRVAQGAGAFAGLGVLADLAGEDRYEASLTNSQAVTGSFIAASQAGVHDPGALTPGYALLLEQGGDDAYASEGFVQTQAGINQILTPSVAVLADTAGSDLYTREDDQDYWGVVRVRAPSSAHFLDTDPQQPAVHIRKPAADTTLRQTGDITVQARDLDDMFGTDGARWVTDVEAWVASQSPVSLTQQADTDTWTGTLDVSNIANGPTTLTARASNVDGATATDEIPIEVLNNAPPMLGIEETITRAGPETSPAVELDLSNTSDPDGDDLTYTIAWGDGEQTTRTSSDDLTSVSHTYATGTYTIDVTVEDTAANTDETIIDVDLSPPGFASAAVTDVTHDTADVSVELDADGDLAASLQPEEGSLTVQRIDARSFELDARELSSSTSYTITLTASDEAGNSAETSVSFTTSTVPNQPPEVDLTLTEDVIDTGDSLTASIQATDPEDGALAEATVSWGDGSQDTVNLSNGEGQATHTFTERCTCTVRATAMDSDGATTSNQTDVLVDTAPTASLVLPASPAPEHQEQTITLEIADADNDTLAATLLVDGLPVALQEDDPEDATTSDGKLFTASLERAPGEHLVQAEVSDGDRNGTDNGTYTVNHAPEITGTVDPFSGSTGASFTYNATTSDGDGDAVNVSLLVDTDSFDLGSQRTKTLSLEKGQHRFALVASDGVDTVRWPAPGAWAFGPIVGNVSRVDVSLTEEFAASLTAKTSSGFDEWTQRLGALGIEEDTTSQVFVRGVDEDEGPGPASTLNVTMDELPTPTIEVLTDTPVPTGEEVQLSGSAQPSAHGDEIQSLDWQLGDGTQATGAAQTHAFADDGTYTITLEATDSQGRSDTTSTSLTVLNRAPNLELAHSPAEPVTLETVSLTLEALDPDGTVASHEITVFDGDSPADDVLASGASDQLEVSFPDDGSYLVVGEVVDDDGASAKAERLLTVFNQAPTAALAVTPSQGFVGQNVTYNASESQDVDGEVTDYVFEPGDDNRTRVSTPELRHAYTQVDNYEVNLTVEDDDGGLAHDGPVPIEIHAFEALGDQEVAKGRQLGFLLETQAPANASPAALSMDAPGLPSEASFEDHDNGTGSFTWQTTVDDVGSYEANFTATLPTSELTQTIAIDVTPEEPAAVIQETRAGYDSIQAAVDAAQASQTILVHPGEHVEELQIDTPGLTLCPADEDDRGCAVGQHSPVLASDAGTGIQLTAEDVHIAGLDIRPTGAGMDTVGVALGASPPVEGLILEQNRFEPGDQLVTGTGGQAIVGALTNALVLDNELEAWQAAIDLTASNLTTSGNAFTSNTVAISLHASEEALLAGERIDGGSTGIAVHGGEDVRVEDTVITGTLTGITVSPDEAGAQASGLSVNNTYLALTETPLVLTSATEGVHIEATCNDWGAYHREAIDERIMDNGQANTLTIQPWQGPNPEVTAYHDCLVEPIADFSFTPEEPDRTTEVAFTDASQPGTHEIVEWHWDFDDNTTSSERNPTHQFTDVGTHQVALTVEDANGMQSTTTHPVQVTNLAPNLEVPGPQQAVHTENLTFQTTATSPEDDAIRLTATGQALDEGAVFTVEDQDTSEPTGTFTWNPEAIDRGSYQLEIRATDEHGTTTTDTITLTVMDDAPSLQAIPDQATRLEHPISFEVTATDPNADPITLAAANPPANATFTVEDQTTASPVGTFTWTPTNPEAVGQHNLTFTADAEGLTDAVNASVTVGEANTPPVIHLTEEDGTLAGDTLTLQRGDNLQLNVTVEDPDGPEVPTPSVDEQPSIDAELAITDTTETHDGNGSRVNATYTWTATTQARPVNVTFAATDGFDEATSELTLTVIHPPDIDTLTPRIDEIDAISTPALVGEHIELRAAASDVDEDLAKVTFTLADDTSIPATQDEEGAWIATTLVPADAPGQLAYNLTATDEAGLTTEVQASVPVEANPGPTARLANDEVRVTDGVSPVSLDATPSTHPLDRPITHAWTLPAQGSGSAMGAQAGWVPPAAGVYTATATITDHLGASHQASAIIIVEDAVIGTAQLTSHPGGEVGTQERPTASVLAVDEVGLPISGATAVFTVTHETAGQLTQETRQTQTDGLMSLLLPFDTDTQPGTNLPGTHELEVLVQTDSDMEETPDVLEDRTVIGYEVTAP